MYKRQYNTNQYKFYLLNLLIPDEYGVGFPVAHFIINYLDEMTLACVLKIIVDKFPNMEVNCVMTDGDEAIANAVETAFGKNVRHLLCLWHVKRNWLKNLKTKGKSNSLTSEILE